MRSILYTTGGKMAILQVRNIDDALYSLLKERAKNKNRTISQEVIYILEKYLSNPEVHFVNATKEFIALCGAWDDIRSADDIINYIKKSHKNSKRFNTKNVLFD